MKKILALIFCLLLSVPCMAAEGDITAVRILGTDIGNGWEAEIDITDGDTLGTGGTYDFGFGTNNDATNAKVVFTATSMSFNDVGDNATITRILYGTHAVRKRSPNEADNNETTDGSTITLTIALSDYVYVRDTVTVAIASGLYTVGAMSTASYSGNPTNGSTLAYPKSIARWAWPGYERVTGDFLIEVVAFNRFGQQQRPVKAVVFTCADAQGSPNTVTQIVNYMTKSTRTGDANPSIVYAAIIPVATLTHGDVITCNFKAYPWVGDSGSILNSDIVANGGDGVAQPDERLGPLYFVLDKTGAYGAAYVVVDATNGQVVTTWDSGGKVYGYATQADAETSYSGDNTLSVKTIGGAVQVCKDFNTDTYARANPGGCHILLNSGDHAYPGVSPAATQGVQTEWTIIEPMSNSTKAQAVINSGSNASLKAQKIKVSGVTVNSNSTGQFVGQAATDVLWLHGNDLTVAGAAPAYQWATCYATQNIVTTFKDGFKAYSTNRSPWALFRGNTVNTQYFVTTYAILGNNGKIVPLFQELLNVSSHQTSDNSIVAYNTIYNTSTEVTMARKTPLSIGISLVQNIFEKTTSNSPYLQLAADNGNATTTNVLVWHNSVTGKDTGGRANFGYNEIGSVHYHRNWSQIGNIEKDWNNKDDTFPVADASRVGSWSVGYNVGTYGDARVSQTFRGEFDGINTVHEATAGYISDLSAGEGFGDYHITSASSARNLLRNRSVLPFDILGKPRHQSRLGAAGAHEYQFLNRVHAIIN